MSNFSTEGFYEVPEKFKKEFFELHPFEFFNADLIHIVLQYKDQINDADFKKFYLNYCKFYEFSIPLEELINKFEYYPIEEYNNLMKFCLNNE